MIGQARLRRNIAAVAAVVPITVAVMPVSAQPIAPVRIVAEWEPAVGTLISWPLGLPESVAVELAEDDMLFVLVTGPTAEVQARTTLTAWGIDPAHLEFIHTSVQTHWPRDWGPHQIFDGNGEWSIIDPIFEGYPWVVTECLPISSPGGHHGDDDVNSDLADFFGTPLHNLPAYLVGGNILVDGHAAAFSTCAMVGENQQLWTEPQFLQLAEDYLGVEDYHILNNTEDYGIQHIDCWVKPIDEETLLVKQPPVWHEEYERIEINLQMLESVSNCYGRPYRIIRIDCPPYEGTSIAAYTNSLILNTKVLVPLFNIPGDTQALQTYAESMPGYEIIGFPWSSWYYYDALHCRARAVFDRHMLRITHRRLDDPVQVAAEYALEAMIDDRSEAGLISDQLRIYWRLQGQSEWQSELLNASGEPDTYEATIPGQPAGLTIEYYLSAADLSGRVETLPRTAPGGFYQFTVEDPGLTIAATDPPEILAPWTQSPLTVMIDAADESLVPGSALLHARYDGGPFNATALADLGGESFLALLPRALCGESVEYYLSAEGSESGLKTDPPGAPASVYSAEVGQLSEADIWSEDFEAGLPAGWSATGLWQVTSACEVSPPCDRERWAYYGQSTSCNYDTGNRTTGELSAPAITLPDVPPGGEITLHFCSHLQTENEPGYDLAALYLGDLLIDAPAESAQWVQRGVDLTAHAGQSVDLEWRFDSVDDYYNDYHGWQVDGLRLTADALQCAFELPCLIGDADCDHVVDLQDYATLTDCFSGPEQPPEPPEPITPEECRLAFDSDADWDIDLADFGLFQRLCSSGDCNANGLEDLHEVRYGNAEDCNNNALPDACDIRTGLSQDLNGDLIPDEC